MQFTALTVMKGFGDSFPPPFQLKNLRTSAFDSFLRCSCTPPVCRTWGFIAVRRGSCFIPRQLSKNACRRGSFRQKWTRSSWHDFVFHRITGCAMLVASADSDAGFTEAMRELFGIGKAKGIKHHPHTAKLFGSKPVRETIRNRILKQQVEPTNFHLSFFTEAGVTCLKRSRVLTVRRHRRTRCQHGRTPIILKR